MTHLGYIVGGYALTAVALATYVAGLRWRSRALTRAPGLRGPDAATNPRR